MFRITIYTTFEVTDIPTMTRRLEQIVDQANYTVGDEIYKYIQDEKKMKILRSGYSVEADS